MEEILKKIGQLQYEISCLELDKETLTGVTIRTDELKELVKNCSIPDVVRHSCDMIAEEYVYKNDFRFQRTMTHGIWFVTYQNHLITFGQYRHDLEEWVDSNYA